MNEIIFDNKSLLCRLILKAAQMGVLKKAIFSKPCDKNIKKTVLMPKEISGKVMLQAEIFHTDNKATHENTDISDAAKIAEYIEGYMQINLLTTAGDCEYKVSSSGKSVVIGGKKLEGELFAQKSFARVEIGGNNKTKKYILSGNEEFLKCLGVSDKNGRVYDKKQAKFRQINRFLELVRDVEKHLPKESIRICDLCCGKSYLSFAVYHYFSVIKGMQVKMTGMDLKPDVIEYCSDVARKVGFDGLEFICGDIRAYEPREHVDMVISLHACDIATDIVLRKATECQADVILSTPCCHHDLNKKLDCGALAFVGQHSMLRQKLCDAATDALRLKLLEAKGYDVSALELIDPEETPKNILLRGIRKKNFDTNGKAAKAAMDEYLTAYSYLTGGKSPEFT
ncbi:MAG: SAM-dependent methyltransferase [Ruminococcaceae bacterium]|nr:SAM-dependent methyltransferase [Oscillospiraceae bacterium]